MILAISWFIYGADKPESCRNIEPEERLMLMEAHKQSQIFRDEEQEAKLRCACEQIDCPARKCDRKPSWSAIITCPTVWAITFSFLTTNWVGRTSILWPTFMSSIVHTSTTTIGYANTIRGAFSGLYNVTFAWLTASLSIRRPFNISLTTYRRTNQAMATLAVVLHVFLLIMFDCNVTVCILALMVLTTMNGFEAAGSVQMLLDIAKDDNVMISGFAQTLGSLDAFAAPLSGLILSTAQNPDVGDRATWRLVWLPGLVLRVAACLFFVLFARAERTKDFSYSTPKGQCKARRSHGLTV